MTAEQTARLELLKQFAGPEGRIAPSMLRWINLLAEFTATGKVPQI